MDSKFSSYLKAILLYIKNFRYNRNVGAFLFFLLLAIILWFLNELENTYVSNITYPVEYTNPPQDKIFVGELPSHLDLEIRGTGFKLLEFKLGKDLMPIEFHVNAYNLKLKDKGQGEKYYLLTQSARSRISQQLSSELEIVSVTPDTLHFQFADEATRSVPVVSKIDVSFNKQLMLKGKIEIEPDSITLNGPNTVLDTVESIKTKSLKLKDLTETRKTSVPLVSVHPQVKYSNRKVEVTIPVEKYTEGLIKKEIVVRNLPDSVIIRTFPRFVQVRYLVGLSKYENVIPELFKATVDFEDTKKDMEKLQVKIDKAPDYLKSYSYTPHRVDYIIERKND